MATCKDTGCTTTSRKRRNVHFAEEHNVVIEYENPIEIGNFFMIESLYYQPWEMQACKDDLKERARQWRATGFGILLRDTFGDAAHVNPLLTQKRLNAFCQLDEDKYNRGVERYLSKQLDVERAATKRQVIQSIVEHCQYLKSLSGTAIDERHNILALFARHQNRNAELFARRMAKADELVAMRGEDQDSSVEMLLMLAQEQKQLKQVAKTSVKQASQLKPTPAARQSLVASSLAQSRQA